MADGLNGNRQGLSIEITDGDCSADQESDSPPHTMFPHFSEMEVCIIRREHGKRLLDFAIPLQSSAFHETLFGDL